MGIIDTARIDPVCCAPYVRHDICIDSGGRRAPGSSGAAARRSAANVSSVTLTTDVRC